MSEIALLGAGDALTRTLAKLLARAREVRTPDELSTQPVTEAAVYVAAGRGDRWGLPDLDDAAGCLAACARAGIGRVVVLSSAEAIAPHPHHPGPLRESQPTPRGASNSISARWRALEDAARGAVPPESLVLLRPAPVPVRGARDAWSRALGGGFAAASPGRDPSLQLLAPEDLASAIQAVLERGANGLFHVAPRSVVPWRRALRLAGVRPVPLPGFVLRLAAALAPGSVAPPDHWQYLRYFWTVSGESLKRATGFVPRFDSADVARGFGRGPLPKRQAAVRYDDHGFDLDYVDRHGRGLVGFLHDRYWRIETRGMERVPRHGAAIVVGMHRGFMPWDGVMALHGVRRASGRAIRFLIHPTLLRFPFLFDFMIKQGGVPASLENGSLLLDRGELLGFFPDGIQGAFTRYRDAYRLSPAWRDDYARLALRHDVPIVPLVTVGSAEIFPILGKVRSAWWRRVSEWPCIPITPTFPFLPLPLPVKWHTQVLEPILPAAVTRGAANAEAVATLDRIVRERMLEAIGAMLGRRHSWFRGSIFQADDRRGSAERAAS